MPWYVACLSSELRSRPLARTMLGTPIALFRGASRRPAAVLDRCPHRNVPLSYGRVRGDDIECCYHGWRFGGDGACQAIPGLVGEASDRRARRVECYPVVEQDGFVWVATGGPTGGTTGGPTGGTTAEAPLRFPHATDPAYTTVRRHVRFPAGLHACLENALDVPHTAFLHGGLFRGRRAPVEIDVVVRPTTTGVEAEYLGEPRPEGMLGRILAPEGGLMTHVDRFVLPSVAQIEYRLGSNHLIDTAAFTPVNDDQTDLYAAVTFHLRLPHGPVKLAATPIVNRILAQDSAVLGRQAEAIRRFGGEQFASTELDVLGQHIRKLLRQAERGEPPAADSAERRLTMRV